MITSGDYRVPSPSPAPDAIPRSDSKPYVAVLEHSSLLEDTFTEDDTPRVVIDATPPVARKGRGRGRKHKQTAAEDTATDIDVPKKKGRYQLRNRKKHQRFAEVKSVPFSSCGLSATVFSRRVRIEYSLSNGSYLAYSQAETRKFCAPLSPLLLLFLLLLLLLLHPSLGRWRG